MTASRDEAAQHLVRVGDTTVEPGERRRLELPAARLPTGSWISLPVEVWNGARPGPRVWLSGAVHGDEIVGVDIIRRVLGRLDCGTLAGSVIAVPIVNVFGFISESRYLPDRRDLNRSFPGSKRGSLASRLARLFMDEVVAGCEYGIDYHSGSDDRTNLPQIRADLDEPRTRRCALAFGAPVTLHASARDNSLRQAASERGVHVLLFEGGEAKRFHPGAVETGVQGTLRMLRHLEMCPAEGVPDAPPTLEARASRWVRASRSGIVHLEVEPGRRVAEKERLGVIADSFGDRRAVVRARAAGVVIGVTRNPLVNRGDALVHVAEADEDGS